MIPENIKLHDIPFERSPLGRGNIKAYRELKKIIKENDYEIIHCNTPMGGIVTRLAARAAKSGARVIYTAHGFHFYKGAPMLNWLVYCPIEWLFSYMTDTLITINKEDFAFAKKHLHAKNIEYINGVGVDVGKIEAFVPDKEQKLKELGVSEGKKVILSVGELNGNKNHRTVLRAVASMKTDEVYLICGEGEKREALKSLASELGIADRLILPGFRTDVKEIYKCCDIFAFPSFREGLPVSLIEAMASGLPAVCSDIRGNNDLIEDGEGGYLVSPEDSDAFKNAIEKILNNESIYEDMSRRNIEKAREFGFDNVLKKLTAVYFGGEGAENGRENQYNSACV